MVENASIKYAEGGPHKNSFWILLKPLTDPGYGMGMGHSMQIAHDSDTILIHEPLLMRIP